MSRSLAILGSSLATGAASSSALSSSAAMGASTIASLSNGIGVVSLTSHGVVATATVISAPIAMFALPVAALAGLGMYAIYRSQRS